MVAGYRWSRRPRRGRQHPDTNKIYLGSGARFANVYPLFHSGGVSDGQAAASDEKRVFILSRRRMRDRNVWGDGVVRRRVERLADVSAADSGGVELRNLGNAVLDDGHWRVHLRGEPG